MAPRTSFLRSASLFVFPLLLLPQYANGDTESFEVGDLAQYSTSGVPTPNLTGSEIEVTAIVWEGMRIEEATEIIVVNTASPTTITAPPEQGTLIFSPAVLTTFAVVTGNARRGDVGIKLEPAAQNLLVDGIDREGHADYLNVDQAQLPFTDAALVAARNEVVAWALLNARLLNGEIQAHTLHALAVGASALSWLFLSQAGTISSLNIIAAASLQGGWTATECEQQTATQITSCDATPVRTTTATTFKPTYLTGPEPTTEPSSDQWQQFAIASYINPLGDPGIWDRFLAYNSNKVSVLVANVLNGPDYIVNLD
ncbi:hypothetical protein VTL71DRAFT_14991 [Oculimacula yallundae]|uniref:Uncharacterized protein n=1 Tax=Oculimacula yallundae TaxID=86028 RepID=A0ABR4CG07_9HELO